MWKKFGYNTILYLAAPTGIDPTLYEAASMDGAGRINQTIHVTLPCIAPYIALMTVLAIGNVLSAGFDQIFNLYNPAVNETNMQSAQIVISIVPLMLIYPFLQRYFTTGLTIGSVKG